MKDLWDKFAEWTDSFDDHIDNGIDWRDIVAILGIFIAVSVFMAAFGLGVAQ